MPYRSPARFLAPAALLAAVLTVFLVARPELGGSSSSATTSTASKAAPKPKAKPAADEKARSKPKAPAKTYTVKAGDNPGSISEATGVPVVDLLDFNDIDAQSLSVGQKLKLTP